MTTKKINQKNTLMNYGLQGRCFLSYDGNNEASEQGIVHCIVPCQQGDLVLVQYFDWLMGEPNKMELVPLANMIKSEGAPRYTFFEDAAHLRHHLETAVFPKMR